MQQFARRRDQQRLKETSPERFQKGLKDRSVVEPGQKLDRLVQDLGPTLVAAMLVLSVEDLLDSSPPSRVSAASKIERFRLNIAYDSLLAVTSAESAQAARIWFVSSNPWLRDESPAGAIRAGNTNDVLAAVSATVMGAYSG